jgi:hypothetical protein
MQVDENGHGRGLPLNRRVGEHTADAIAGDALICRSVAPPWGWTT